ncbi:hypothetical protein CEP54_000975 [Fusarium duplospermum]|uniref:Uncharacterized protein n=1 Tax=Fusarium duplospermum TaxID=1325734 RepID=A0A428R434_9HYPO|nr:hypothetical protein CEP54_000975 [Fusarium duplospermum]
MKLFKLFPQSKKQGSSHLNSTATHGKRHDFHCSPVSCSSVTAASLGKPVWIEQSDFRNPRRTPINPCLSGLNFGATAEHPHNCS